MNFKYLFFDDYSEGAHPDILEILRKNSSAQDSGYGNDEFTKKAAELIRNSITNPNATVHFVSGGTQANLIVLSALLKPYEAVIAADSAHINGHEAGAIEATGHKIITVPSKDGKVKPQQIADTVDAYPDEHVVKPRAVFISQSTEIGTVYTKSELQELSNECKKHSLYLYLDGARVGSALASVGTDVDLQEIAHLTDVFYIGGTKNGALFGEAIVINNPELQKDFRYYMKQRGALLAKGRVISLQFTALFSNDLFLTLARHANDMAGILKKGIADLGYSFLTDSTTNQIFPIFPNTVIEKLKAMYGFHFWSKMDEKTSSIRLVTSWATPKEKVEEFLEDLHQFS